MSEKITLNVKYDRIDITILEALKYASLTVHQLKVLLRFELSEEISSMAIARKLDYLFILGKVEKHRKNINVLEYCLSVNSEEGFPHESSLIDKNGNYARGNENE